MLTLVDTLNVLIQEIEYSIIIQANSISNVLQKDSSLWLPTWHTHIHNIPVDICMFLYIRSHPFTHPSIKYVLTKTIQFFPKQNQHYIK